MNHSLKTILEQCEKQAEKVSGMEVNDSFLKELDIFDSYFEQLKQLLQNVSLTAADKEKLKELRSFVEKCASKLQTEMKRTAGKIKRTAAEKQHIGYGVPKSSEALKFDKRL